MKHRSWLILAVGFGALVALIALLGLGAIHRTDAIHDEMIAAHLEYFKTDSLLRDVPADLYLMGLLVRDYLLDPSHLTASVYKARIQEIRSSVLARLDTLERRLGAEETRKVQQLRAEVESYWTTLAPVFEWGPAQKAALGHIFLRQQVVLRGRTILSLAEQVGDFNVATLEQERRRLKQKQAQLQDLLWKMTLFTVCLGAVAAFLSASRVFVLEGRAEKQHRELEQAQQELRRLSHSLARALEDERKSLARELHDAVGQMLTAAGMDVSRLEHFRESPEEFRAQLEEIKRLNAETVRNVRDLAMGLRPAMLDDLGLGPALEWQGREFSRRGGVPVTVQLDGTLDGVGEPQRTSIFRIVQEALTNCARHAQAKNVRVLVHGGAGRVELTVQDDGAGFDVRQAFSRGLGLIGIQERVRDLNGSLEIISEPGKGTMLKAQIPAGKETFS